jgi:hypothetical protein
VRSRLERGGPVHWSLALSAAAVVLTSAALLAREARVVEVEGAPFRRG